MSAVAVVRAHLGRALDPVVAALARLGNGAPPGLRRGAGAAPADVPVVVVHLRAGAEENADGVLAAVTAARRAGETFTPVVLLERPALAPYRRAGYAVELVGPQGVAAAREEAVRTYAAVAVVEVSPGDVERSARLVERLLGAVPAPPSGPVAAARRAARAVERLLP
ncbi:hypothetical protein [uncultured Pseudokineococcus sp.]|uniref:hypothetical protein n=1 Tax=uncultured Pseudokineococcus sp. TaxID=1642928 RepID=UPI00261A4637|nr:hypothetical protein [uncultured Pseudokineococcus sp.]